MNDRRRPRRSKSSSDAVDASRSTPITARVEQPGRATAQPRCARLRRQPPAAGIDRRRRRATPRPRRRPRAADARQARAARSRSSVRAPPGRPYLRSIAYPPHRAAACSSTSFTRATTRSTRTSSSPRDRDRAGGVLRASSSRSGVVSGHVRRRYAHRGDRRRAGARPRLHVRRRTSASAAAVSVSTVEIRELPRRRRPEDDLDERAGADYKAILAEFDPDR